MIVSTRDRIFAGVNSLTSGDKNVFHDCDMFAPFSGLPHGGEGEEAEEKSVVKVWRYRVASARIRELATVIGYSSRQ
jgi:hypothetical protein